MTDHPPEPLPEFPSVRIVVDSDGCTLNPLPRRKPLSPKMQEELRRFVINLAIAEARRDHLIATGQLKAKAEPRKSKNP